MSGITCYVVGVRGDQNKEGGTLMGTEANGRLEKPVRPEQLLDLWLWSSPNATSPPLLHLGAVDLMLGSLAGQGAVILSSGSEGVRRASTQSRTAS